MIGSLKRVATNTNDRTLFKAKAMPCGWNSFYAFDLKGVLGYMEIGA
jgi:hypothetical protein